MWYFLISKPISWSILTPAIPRNISFHISIKEKDRDNPSCQTSYFIKPCLYSNIPTFNMDRYLGGKECRILGGVPGVSRLYLSSFFIKFLSAISFFTDQR